MPVTTSYAVVGAGILGAAVARELLRRRPGSQVTVLEKEPGPARHQTGRNSGVVHAGLYYAPGSEKARLTRAGVAAIRELCETHDLPYEECGKILLARTPDDERRLASIRERAEANGVPGIAMLHGSEISDIEPAVTGTLALHSPTTAIVDYGAITRAMLAEAVDGGAHLVYDAEVLQITRAERPQITVAHQGETVPHGPFDAVVVCAGLHADRLARMVDGDPYPRIVPFRGRFMRLSDRTAERVRGLIYPVPDPRYPFLGVHLTRRVDGEVWAGPNAFLAAGREAYGGGSGVDLAELASLLGWPGFLRFCLANARAGASELGQTVLTRVFLTQVQRFLPEVTAADLEPAPAGIRAQAMARDGSLVEDFRIDHVGPVTLVRNAPSPAATASIPIAEQIVRTVLDRPTT